MIVRHALNEERNRLKMMWKRCFGDSDAYTEYYFTHRFHEDRTLVLEAEGEVVSALQCNPYRMRLRGESFDTSYIVGVCTLPEHRGKGYMRRLMCHAMEEAVDRGECFMVLKPVAKELYWPYQFDYCFDFAGEKPSLPEDTGEGGLLSDRVLDRFVEQYGKAMEHRNAYGLRDRAYYEEVLRELSTEGGKCRVIKDGYILYYPDGMVREWIAGGSVINPNLDIMARMTDVQRLLSQLHFDGSLFAERTIELRDAFLPENNGRFRLIFRNGHCMIKKIEEKCDIICDISQFTQLIFGYQEIGDPMLDQIFDHQENYFIEEV